MAENMPCNSLPMAYVFIESPALLTMLKTCNSTEIPPNPNKKLAETIFTDIAFMCVCATKLTPFVSSIIPDRMGFISSVGKPIAQSTGESKADMLLKIPLWFNIDITTENITTKPPIIKMVDIEFVMLFPNTSPSDEMDTDLFE